MESKCLFRSGDRVWDILFGWGTVICVKEDAARYPVLVKHDNIRYATYTMDGEGSDGVPVRRLFFEEIPIPKSALERPRKTAEQMLEECEEVEFLAKHNNHAIGYIPATNQIVENLDWICKRVGVKYISRQDAERIVRECAENNG